jgi:hypothetical protein
MDIEFKFSKYVLKPLVATFIMSVCSYAIYILLLKVMPLRLSAIIAMIMAIIIYALAIVCMKLFTKEEIYMIPYGQKLYQILVKMGIYKEKTLV